MPINKPDCWQLVESALRTPGKHLLLWGPPGTGKTTEATNVGPNSLVVNMTFSEDTPAAELRGHFVLKGGDQGSVWMHGPAMQAWIDSNRPEIEEVRFVGNELAELGGDGMTFMHAILDDPGSLATKMTLPTGMEVRPTAKFKFIGTTNGRPEDLDEALVDRLTCIHIDKVHPKAFERLPEYLRPVAEDTALTVGDARISIRRWIDFADYTSHGVPREHAAYLCFGDRAEALLDAVKLARAAKRKVTHPDPIENSNFDSDYTSYEDIDPDSEHYCGWHRRFEEGTEFESKTDPCRVTSFLDEQEFHEFLDEWTTDPDNRAELWQECMLRRTRTRNVTQDVIDMLPIPKKEEDE